MIEKRVSEALLDSGEIPLTDLERDRLELPLHSSTVELELEGDSFHAQWSGAGRFLHGDILAERLQDFGQVGGLLRVVIVGERLRLELVAAPSSGFLQPRTPTRFVRPQTAAPKSRPSRKPIEQRFYTDADYAWADGVDAKVGFLKEARDELTDQLAKSGFDPAEWLTLRLEGEHLATMDEFEELLAVDVSNVDRMPHQEAVTRRVLAKMGGRAILADEVGLGKTIEAGLAVKELVMRGRARRILVLCPATLREQWQQELSSKFELAFDVAWRGQEIRDQDRLIISLTLAAREAAALTSRSWDVVIVDEAHRAAGAGAKKRQQLLEALSRTSSYALFLTATPVQNDLMELYRLVQLLRPGTFRSASEFRSKFMRNDDPRKPKDPANLRSLINSAMVRMTRSQAGLDRVKRSVSDIPLALTDEERDLYERYVKVLRTVASGPANAGRTRSLSIMLTALPGAMGARLLRMAERTSDPGLAADLRDLAERALSITNSGRERAALDLVRRFLREHGRVLIFTQHTDSLISLVRTLAREGIESAAFHGSMAPGERARAIAQFRDGSKPVLVSTDAGAEGQNLQFCNCVINFDLPWNPMRIEQRIGRVDRLTQPKDTVYVANLFALGTIDERVYRLLAEKLKMFELLFGQVTTILGELDDTDLTFEGRIIKAVTSSDDNQMNRQLDSLGSDLSEARKTAGDYIAADSSLSEWLRTTFDHRSDIDRRGAAELSVEIEERTRERQRRVQHWLRSVIEALDAEIVHDTGDQQGAFVTLRFGDDMADELGGRTVLHLAFDRDGLEHHPDAELCAVGTPVFTEVLQIVRQRGDIHATVPVLPELGSTTLRHSPRIELVERKFVPSGSWSGTAVYRAAIGEAEQSERVESVRVGDAEAGTPTNAMTRRALQVGDSLPAALDHAPAVIARFERAAANQFSNRRVEKYEEIRGARRADLDRIRDGYRAQIAEAKYDDVDRLERALELEEQRLGRDPDVRVRARLLSVTLHEDDWSVQELWRHVDGTERTRNYPWRANGLPRIVSDVSGNEADVVALCSSGHWIDESEARLCASCDGDRCQACGSDGEFGTCELCGTTACGHCLSSTGGFCLPCSTPERAPELDLPHASGWRFRSGNTALVSERACVVTATNGTQRIIVPDIDVDDDDRVRVRAYAASIGLPADVGLAFISAEAPDDAGADLLLSRDVTIDVEQTVTTDGGSGIDLSAVQHIPFCPEVDVQSERGARMHLVLARLREEQPPPTAPSIVITQRPQVREVRLVDDRITNVVTVSNPDGTVRIAAEQEALIQWSAPSPSTHSIGSAEVDDERVDIHLCNEAVLVVYKSSTGVRRWIAIDPLDDPAEQQAWARVLEQDGAPGGRIGRRREDPELDASRFPRPSSCDLVDRHMVRMLCRQPAHGDVERATSRDMSKFRMSPHGDPALGVVPRELAEHLLRRAHRDYTSEIAGGYRVTETWQGHASATTEYISYDGNPRSPLGDDAPVDSEFGVCSNGHFHPAHGAVECAACGTTGCDNCEPPHVARASCPACGHLACERCCAATHEVQEGSCAVCSDEACYCCGRDPIVAPCGLCARPTCRACRPEELCVACAALAPASEVDARILPPELSARGSNVWIGRDARSIVAVIQSGRRLERAIVDLDGTIADWVSFDSLDHEAAALCRSFSSVLDVPVDIAYGQTRKPEPPGRAALLAHRAMTVKAAWEAPDLGRSGMVPRGHRSTGTDLASDLLTHLHPGALIEPRHMPNVPDAIRRIVGDQRHRVQVVQVFWAAAGAEVFVTPDGLLSRTSIGSAVSERLVAWNKADDPWPWVADAWTPAPKVRGVARVEDVEAAVVSIANLTSIGFRVGDAVTWLDIDGGDSAVGASALAQAWGLPAVDGLGAWTDPNAVVTSTVNNGTGGPKQVLPLPGNVAPSANPGDPGAAIAAWASEVVPRCPASSRLTGPVADDFIAMFAPTTSRFLAIGASVEQRLVVDGSDVVFKATLIPGDHDARRRDDITGSPLDSGTLDRSGHFVATAEECPYCKKLSCQLCTDGARTCRGCGVTVCLPCATTTETLTICSACTLVAPATRKQAHDYGRRLFAGGLFVGVDAVHTVAYEQKGSRWLRHTGESSTVEVSDDAVRSHLDQRAAKK